MEHSWAEEELNAGPTYLGHDPDSVPQKMLHKHPRHGLHCLLASHIKFDVKAQGLFCNFEANLNPEWYQAHVLDSGSVECKQPKED